MKCHSTHPCELCHVKSLTVFHLLPLEQLQEMGMSKSCLMFKKGQYIFAEHSYPLGLYCISEGKVKLFTTGPDGKEQILRFAKSGNIIGYRSLMCDEPYHSSAIAIEDTDICFIPKAVFTQLITTNPRLSLELIKVLGNDLKEAEEHILSLSQKNVRERLAEALLFFQALYGVAEDGQTLKIKLSREEIADYVGTSTETIIRFLSELNNDKIIATEGKKIKILNLPKLTQTANRNL